MTKTEKIIESMLKENTGTAMCDSGGDDGRHWQKNQGHDFKKDRLFTLYLTDSEFSPCFSLYHFLAGQLNYSDAAAMYDGLLKKKYPKGAQYADISEFADYLKEEFGAKGIYGNGVPVEFNTYNGDDCLSQVLQGVIFSIGKKSFVALQIHNGADVRGGYTDARIFEIDEYLDTQSQTINCIVPEMGSMRVYTDDGGVDWYTDDGRADIKPVEGEPKTDPKRIMVNGIVCEPVYGRD